MRALLHVIASAAVIAVSASGCTVKKADDPPSSGPSELSTSLTVTATPDRLPQDGASQSQIVVFARDGMARPIGNLSLRAEMVVGGSLQDFGTLSARTLVTGGDGRATVTYTAPNPVFGTVGELVTIQLTPIGTDANAAVSRTVSIQLVAPGVINPTAPKVPDFTISPGSPLALQPVVFDASDPALDGSLARYQWSFGDGTSGQGRIAQHAYKSVGSFAVTLTVTDTAGGVASRTKPVNVGGGTAPTASFVFSPTAPIINQLVFFNASASVAAPGRTITQHRWNFGTGQTASGQVVSRAFSVAGSYNVTLTVTDNAGLTATTSQTVTVGTDAPTAAFVFSPSSPQAGNAVLFNAGTSTAVLGRTIVSYDWDFGDGNTDSGQIVNNVFAAAGAYSVVLTITDSGGKTGTLIRTVTVAP